MGDLLTAQTLVDLAVELESAGWDGVLLEDYLVYYRGDDPATYDPWMVLAAVAGRTSTLMLGTGVTGLLARDPVEAGSRGAHPARPVRRPRGARRGAG